MSARSYEKAPGVRWSWILLAVLLCLLAGEWAARIGIERYVGQPFRSLDPYTFSGYGLYRQNALYTHPQFIHNSVGFRNLREFSIEPPPDTLRIMAIGASVLYAGSALTAHGFSKRVSTGETITAYLEEELATWPELEGVNLEIINASVNRHMLRHTIAYYVAELGRYQPDVVLVFGSYNDSSRLEHAAGESKLFYDRADPTVEEARLELLANEASFRALMEKTVRVAVNRSALAAAGYRFVDRGMRRVMALALTPSLEGPVEAPPDLASPQQFEKNYRFYVASLEALLSYIETAGARPVVFWEYLLLMVEDQKPLTEYERSVAEFLKSYTGGIPEEQKEMKREVLRRLKERLGSRNRLFIDPIEEMKSFRGEIFNDYLHYSGEGNLWAARVVAKEIRPLINEVIASREDLASMTSAR